MKRHPTIVEVGVPPCSMGPIVDVASIIDEWVSPLSMEGAGVTPSIVDVGCPCMKVGVQA